MNKMKKILITIFLIINSIAWGMPDSANPHEKITGYLYLKGDNLFTFKKTLGDNNKTSYSVSIAGKNKVVPSTFDFPRYQSSGHQKKYKLLLVGLQYEITVFPTAPLTYNNFLKKYPTVKSINKSRG